MIDGDDQEGQTEQSKTAMSNLNTEKRQGWGDELCWRDWWQGETESERASAVASGSLQTLITHMNVIGMLKPVFSEAEWSSPGAPTEVFHSQALPPGPRWRAPRIMYMLMFLHQKQYSRGYEVRRVSHTLKCRLICKHEARCKDEGCFGGKKIMMVVSCN